jgi:hypothetical protein
VHIVKDNVDVVIVETVKNVVTKVDVMVVLKVSVPEVV